MLAAAPIAVSVEDAGKVFERPYERYSKLKEQLVGRSRSHARERLAALDGVSCDIRRGEFFGIVGRNGSGKSTLLRCIAGVYGLDSGAVAIDGRVSPFIELGAGFNPDLTARDNVTLSAVLRGLSRAEARARFDTIIDFAELREFVDMKLRNYSSGMSVRLAYSVASHIDADVLLVDEVLAVGDSAFRAKCFGHFERMKDEGRTVVFVTHSMEQLERLCDRAMLLDHGKVVAVGRPAEVARAYEEVNAGVPADEVRARLPSAAAPPQPDSGGDGAHRGMQDQRGRRSYAPTAFGGDARRVAQMTFTLAETDFRLHYLGSVLGYLWSVMRPLMLFGVLYLVFTQIVRFGGTVENYAAYLLCAIVLWTFFAETTSSAVGSLVKHAGLMRAVRFPRTVIPLSVSLRSLFNLGVNLLVALGFVLASGVRPRLSWLELPLLVGFLGVLAAGLAMLLSALFVRFRDVGQIWAVVLQLLFYGSPILYVASQYPGAVRDLVSVSPLAVVFIEMRRALIDPAAPSAAAELGGVLPLLAPLAIVAGTVAVGVLVFRRETPGAAENI